MSNNWSAKFNELQNAIQDAAVNASSAVMETGEYLGNELSKAYEGTVSAASEAIERGESIVNQIQKDEELNKIKDKTVSTVSNVVENATSIPGKVFVKENQETVIAATSIAAGTAVGAGVSATVGGMGLLVAGTGVSIGAAPVAAAGAVAGSAVYGVKKAIEEQDPTAIGAAVVGAGVGAGASAVVGGMGLAFAGTAVGVTMAPVAAVGAVVGLAGYGVYKLFEGKK